MWTLLKKYKSGCRECFWPNEDPNKIAVAQETKIVNACAAHKNIKQKTKPKSIVINPYRQARRY